MKLIEIVSKLNDPPEETFICVRRPWNHNAESVLVPFNDDLSIPQEVKSQGYEYFLEVTTAREILDAFLDKKPSLEQVTDFIIYYAENDAFPEWAFNL